MHMKPTLLCSFEPYCPTIYLTKQSLKSNINELPLNGELRQLWRQSFWCDWYQGSHYPDAVFGTKSLEEKFLPGGELRIRCRVKVFPSERRVATAIPTLTDDIRNGSVDMTFTDAVLVRFQIIIVCTFVQLSTRSIHRVNQSKIDAFTMR